MKRQAIVVLVFVALFAGACGSDTTLTTGGQALVEPAYDAWALHGEDGVLLDSGMEVHPEEIGPSLKTRKLALSSRAASVHPRLQAALADSPDEEVLEVVLSVHSNHRLSYLPLYDPTRDRDDPYNEEVLAQRQLALQADDQLRSLERQPVVAAIERLGGQVTEEFAVGNAIAATLSAGALKSLLGSFSEIVAASPAVSGEAPSAYYDIDDGRDRQNSDWYESWGYDGNGYRIGLTDTGVYLSHNVFNNPRPISIWRDCAYTLYSSCTRYPVYPWNILWNPDDTRGSGGHGTFMADVLVGNDNLGDAYRGVAPDAWVDSTNVYTNSDHSSLYTIAVLRAFSLLVVYDDVIVANITANENPMGTIALAADDLYDAGVIVVAPVGNNSAEYAYSPACAHKVLGIGGYYTSNGNDYSPQSGGTSDSRFKPDVTAPTVVRGAANTGVSNVVQKSGTCPAAAFAGGAATVLRDYYDYRGWSSDPGAVYAAMITFGDEGGSDLDNSDGAGNLELGELSSSYWISGVKYLDHGETQYVYFTAGSNYCALRSAIWWAEDNSDNHNAVYLYLYQGSTWKASSYHGNSVFQKVMHTSTLGSGSWKIRLYASSYNQTDNLKVHYLIHMRTNCY